MNVRSQRITAILACIGAIVAAVLLVGHFMAVDCARRAAKFYQSGRFEDSIRNYKFASMFLPASADIHCRLAYALQAARHFEESASEAVIASRLAPSDKNLRERCGALLERVGYVQDQVVDQYDDMVKRWPDDNALKLSAALIFAQAHKNAQAEELLAEYCIHNSGIESVWTTRADLFMDDNDVADGTKVLQNGVRHLPESVAIRYQLAKLLLVQGKRDQSIAQLQAAARIDPANIQDFNDLLDRIKSPEHARDIYILLHRGHNSYYLDAQINGKAQARLLLDTGASSCLLSRNVARKAALDPRKGHVTGMETASDVIAAIAITIPQVTIGLATQTNVEAAVADMPGSQDGLLGITFLRHYDFTIDTKNNLLILKQRKSSPALVKR